MRRLGEYETTSNRRYFKLMRRQKVANEYGLCSICPPHAGENARGKYYYKYKVKKAFQLRRRGKRV